MIPGSIAIQLLLEDQAIETARSVPAGYLVTCWGEGGIWWRREICKDAVTVES